MTDDIFSTQFAIGAENAAIWALSARRLKQSADLLFDAHTVDLIALGNGSSPLALSHLELAGPATLLFGLALENILKGIIIQRDPQPVVGGKLRQWPTNGHDLLRLAAAAAVALDQQESDLLRRAGAFVEWAGRYPIPKRMTDLASSPSGSGYFAGFPVPLTMAERSGFDRLFNRLYATVIDEEQDEDISAHAV